MERMLTALVASLLVFGCSDPDASALIAKANPNQIKRLANLYANFQSRHSWQGPKDKAELLEYIKSMNETKLQRMGVDTSNIEGLFTSPRDGKPYEIRYGLSGGIGAKIPVIFEAEGVDGERQVGFVGKPTETVDAARYDALLTGNDDKAAVERN